MQSVRCFNSTESSLFSVRGAFKRVKPFLLPSQVWALATLLLLKGCPEQVDGWFSGQVSVAGLLVDVSHNVSAVALYIFCILQSERERASWRRCRGGREERKGGGREAKKRQHV